MSITSANAVIMFSIPNLYNTPQQLQGFAADDIFDTEIMDAVETLMGVDGILSGGKVFAPVSQGYALQADSPSISIFDTWWGQMQVLNDVYTANATVTFPGLQTKYALTKGFLTKYPPIPDAKKILQPRKFSVMWQGVQSQPYTA